MGMLRLSLIVALIAAGCSVRLAASCTTLAGSPFTIGGGISNQSVTVNPGDEVLVTGSGSYTILITFANGGTTAPLNGVAASGTVSGYAPDYPNQTDIANVRAEGSGSFTVQSGNSCTGGLNNFAVSAPSSAQAGVGFNITVTARTSTNSTVTNYAGYGVALKSSDPS